MRFQNKQHAPGPTAAPGQVKWILEMKEKRGRERRAGKTLHGTGGGERVRFRRTAMPPSCANSQQIPEGGLGTGQVLSR